MLNGLNIIHRRKPDLFTETEFPVWSTCLRSLAFASHDELAESRGSDEAYSREQAYRFLLEIVCGLHSPILGETEVFGQFKTFAARWIELQPERAPLVQRILADAKAIRTRHLENLGVQSYGSWVRKHIRSEDVHILGGGQLAREILPYLEKHAKSLTVHVRDPRKVTRSARALSDRAFTQGALIIAAPVSAEYVQSWLGHAKPTQVFDLREDAHSDEIRGHAECHRLVDIFRDIEETKKRLQPVIQAARAEIQSCTEKIAGLAIIRPLGWDDLCA